MALPAGLVVTFSEMTVAGNCPNTSTITRSWSVADGCGNGTSLVQVITIQDATPPTFTFVPASTIEQCSASIPPLGTPTATDNCDTRVTIVYNGETSVPGNCLNSRVVTRSWTASDDCGNAATAVQVISVNDNQAPTLVCKNATVDLTIFGTVSVNVSSLIQTLSDNCTPESGPSSFRRRARLRYLRTAGRYRTGRHHGDGPECGNVSTCTAQVTVNPFVRCTPKILITDPCVCKNNATTTENGQFGETLKIESLAGKTLTITAVSGLFSANSQSPPVAPIPFPAGTKFVENPVNSGDYFLNSTSCGCHRLLYYRDERNRPGVDDFQLLPISQRKNHVQFRRALLLVLRPGDADR